MKKLFFVLLILNIILLNSCSSNIESITNESITNKFKEIEKYIYEVEEYTTLDYDFADGFFADLNDNWDGGCSAISAMVDGHRLIGRNMDLNITNKCSYIIRTNVGKYKTIGVTYTHRNYSPDYEDIKANGFSEDFYKILPFMCDDVLNDAGLHVEVNMRHGECWPNGEDKFAFSFPLKYDMKNSFVMPECFFVCFQIDSGVSVSTLSTSMIATIFFIGVVAYTTMF